MVYSQKKSTYLHCPQFFLNFQFDSLEIAFTSSVTYVFAKNRFATCQTCRPVVPGCARCAMAHPDFGRSVNPISTRGTDYARLINTAGTPGFSDLPTALTCKFFFLSFLKWIYFSLPALQTCSRQFILEGKYCIVLPCVI